MASQRPRSTLSGARLPAGALVVRLPLIAPEWSNPGSLALPEFATLSDDVLFSYHARSESWYERVRARSAMHCPTCHHENRTERRFCAECGGALVARCTSCGEANQPGEKFCGGCGAGLAARPMALASHSSVRTAPRHLAEKI